MKIFPNQPILIILLKRKEKSWSVTWWALRSETSDGMKSGLRLVMEKSENIDEETELLQFWKRYHMKEDIVKMLEHEMKRIHQQQTYDFFEEDDNNKNFQSNGESSTFEIRSSLLALYRQRSFRGPDRRKNIAYINPVMDTEYTDSDMSMEISEEPMSR